MFKTEQNAQGDSKSIRRRFRRLDQKGSHRASRRPTVWWSAHMVSKKNHRAAWVYLALLEMANELGSSRFEVHRKDISERTGINRFQTISEALNVLSRDANWMDKFLWNYYVQDETGKSSLEKKLIVVELLNFRVPDGPKAVPDEKFKEYMAPAINAPFSMAWILPWIFSYSSHQRLQTLFVTALKACMGSLRIAILQSCLFAAYTARALQFTRLASSFALVILRWTLDLTASLCAP